jgi:hypothetical protein
MTNPAFGCFNSVPLTYQEEGESMAVESHIREVADKHRRIQELIEAEMAHSGWDEMRIAALKKEKLRLKDELERLRTESH